MTDFSTLVEYDTTHPVNILNPITGEDTGIKINVVSHDSRRVVNALRKLNNEYFRSLAVAGEDVSSVELPDSDRLKAIHCIDSWDWGSASFGHITGDGVASLADREYLVDHPNSGWIVGQVLMGCANIENFTQASQKPALRGSKKT